MVRPCSSCHPFFFQTNVEKDLRGIVKITVGLGGAMCLAAAALQLLGLVPGHNARLPVLLKVATAGTHSAAMLALLECDTRQVKKIRQQQVLFQVLG